MHRQWTLFLILACALSALCAYTARSSRNAMASYSSAVQHRYMIDHTQSRDIMGVVYLPPDVTADTCALTLYSAVLMAYCPLRTQLVVVHADDDDAADTAIAGARMLMQMLRRRNMTESVCTHVEDHLTCVQASVAGGNNSTLSGYFSYGALVRAGVVMTPHWDQRMLEDMSAQKGVYACWAQTVEHTFGHVTSADDTTSIKQYVDRVFDDGVCEGTDERRPLFPQLVYGMDFDEQERSIPDVRPVACLGGEDAVDPLESAICSATMCFGPLEQVSRCCTLLPVLCTARLACPQLDILMTVYLTRLLSIVTYLVPSCLMCRSFSADDTPPSQEDVAHLREYLYTDDASAPSFRRERLGIGGSARCRQRRMMGLVGGSKVEIQHKYRSMDMYMRVYRQRMREERPA